jgi:hypothetical protein
MKMLLPGGSRGARPSSVAGRGYLAVSEQDPFILNPDSELAESDFTMAMFCGDGSGSRALDKVPAGEDLGPWTKGRTMRGDCDICYHHSLLYNPHTHESCLVGCDHDFFEQLLR